MSVHKGIIRYLTFIYLIIFASIETVNGASFPSQILIGVLAKSGIKKCFQQWNPTAAYLREKLPDHYAHIVCIGFDGFEQAVAEKRVDFTITDPSVYVNLESKHGISRLATLKNKVGAKAYTRFGGVILYRADRHDIKSAQDLKGKSFMAVAETSFGGWQVAWRYLQERGVDPHRDFQELHFGKRPESVVKAVLEGRVDAGSVRTDTLERMASKAEINLNDFAILEPQAPDSQFNHLRTTRLYPEWPLAKLKDTAPELAKQVALAMMQMRDNSIAAFYSNSKGWTIPLDYHEVHDTLRLLKIEPYADFGIITPSQLYHQYKSWIFLGGIILACLLSGGTVVLLLNRKLKSALVDLDSEHQQRALVMADLNEFKLTLEQTLDCVFMFSPDNLRFIYANHGALQQVGYSRKELLGMTPVDIKPDLTEFQFRSLIAPLIKDSEQGLTFTTNHQRKDGSLTPVEISLRYITPPGKQGRFVAIVRDITLLRQQEVENKLLQTKLLHEQKLASVGQLASGIAHEINTPAQYLGANIDFFSEAFDDISRLITNYDHLLAAAKKQEISQQLIDATENTLEEVDWHYLKEEIPLAISQSIEGVKQVSSIVLAMKNFAHPGGTDKELANLNELLQTTLTVSRNEWKYCAEPLFDLAPNLPAVPCMRNELAQVFLNLIVNAAHSIADKLGDNQEGQKGRITISSKHEGSDVVITVADSGSGISTENLTKIFDPFFTTKEVGKGTGQGLTIAYDIITNKHNGNLTVTSEEDVGTTFTIQLPLNPAQQDNTEEKHHG